MASFLLLGEVLFLFYLLSVRISPVINVCGLNLEYFCYIFMKYCLQSYNEIALFIQSFLLMCPLLMVLRSG